MMRRRGRILEDRTENRAYRNRPRSRRNIFRRRYRFRVGPEDR